MGQSLSQAYGSDLLREQKNNESLSANIRVAIPGIIQSFNADEQTVRVQPAITEMITGSDYIPVSVMLPELLDVPIVLPRAGDYVLTMPIQAGDECLVIFSDMCIDAWWQNGGVQSQMEQRRHDLSDGFAILGTWSQPRRLASYSKESAQLINCKTGTGISISEKGVTVYGSLTVVGDTKMQGALLAGGVNMVGHTHQCHSDKTGGPQ